MSYPILYKADEADFSHLGLGILTDTVECLVTEERNGMYELTMQYPIDGALFSEIKNDRLVKVRASNNSHNQRFKIIRITKPAKGIVTIYAEHVSYLTADLPLAPEVIYNGSAQTALNTWKNSIVVDNPFTVFSDIATIGNGKWTIDNVESARRALGGVQGSLLDTYGGEYFFDNYSIGLYANRGEDNGTLIAYGKNLVDLEQEEEIAGTYTSVYPYVKTTGEDGTERLVTLSEIFIDSPHKDSYARRKIRVVDFTADGIKTEEALRARAEQYIEQNNIGLPKVNLRVKFVDLAKTLDYKDLKLIEEVNLCDIVTIHFEKLGINQKAKVIKTVWNVLLDRYEEIEIGESRATLTQTISTEIKESEQHTTIQLDGLRQQIINSYWNSDGYNYDLRVGNEYGLPGGYYSFDKPIDQNPERAIYMGAGTLLIANSKDAQGNWTWRTMATGDGLIADVITAGMLKGIIISNGDGTFYVDELGNMTATSGDIAGFDITDNSLASSTSKTYAPLTTAERTRLSGITLGNITPTQADYDRFDIDNNGRINALDALYFNRIEAGIQGGVFNYNLSLNTNNPKEIIKLNQTYFYGVNNDEYEVNETILGTSFINTPEIQTALITPVNRDNGISINSNTSINGNLAISGGFGYPCRGGTTIKNPGGVNYVKLFTLGELNTMFRVSGQPNHRFVCIANNGDIAANNAQVYNAEWNGGELFVTFNINTANPIRLNYVVFLV